MSSVPRLSHDKRFYRTGSTASRSKVLLYPEQKNMLGLKDIISNITLQWGLVLDCYAGTFSVADACMLQPQHRRFVRFDLDSACAAQSLLDLAIVLGWQLLSKQLDITEDDDVQWFAFAFLKARKELGLKRRIHVWVMPTGFSIMQTLFLPIL